jgi:hypothetical protein
MEIVKGDELIGLAWFTPTPSDPGLIEAHVCVHPDHRRRWLTRGVINALWSIVDYSKATACVAQVTSPEIGSIWRRLGFTIIEPLQLAIINLKEHPNGFHETKASPNAGPEGSGQGPDQRRP